MDIVAILNSKLEFIERFYLTASEPFATVIAKIEKHEEPYHVYDIEDPVPFDIAWQENRESLNVLGQCCLALVQRVFKEFLDEFVVRRNLETGKDPKIEAKKLKEGTGCWLHKYQKYFVNTYRINWENAPVDASFLEEISLARNAVWHDGSVWDLTVKQNQAYYKRFPDSLFADEYQKAIWPSIWGESLHEQPHVIEVTAVKLRIATEAVRVFCSYLDEQWESHAQFLE